MEKIECSCEVCKRACTYTPGWFLPGEAEKAAEYLHLTLKEFFDKYLGVNWWEADGQTKETIFVLAPAITSMYPGEEYPGDPQGTCIFLEEDDSCKLHAVKPFECSAYFHTDTDIEVNARHYKIALAWTEHQQQIEELLGHEPEAREYHSGSSPWGWEEEED